MTAKIKHSDYLDLAKLTKTAGGSSAWRELIDGETYIVVEGCEQAALEAALADKAVVADTTAREAATAKAAIISQLAATNEGMVRTIEDILAALVVKGLILKTDIPQVVLDKIAAREALRSQLT